MTTKNLFPNGNYIYILTGRTRRLRKQDSYVGKTNNLLRRLTEHIYFDPKKKKGFGNKCQPESIKLVYFEQTNPASNILNLLPQVKGQEKSFKELFNRQKIFRRQRKVW